MFLVITSGYEFGRMIYVMAGRMCPPPQTYSPVMKGLISARHDCALHRMEAAGAALLRDV
jgi:hypothetical protein